MPFSVGFDPFSEAIVLRHYEYELNIPLAAPGACVEGRHIADLLFSLSD